MSDTLKARREKVKKIAPALERAYPDARCLLDHKTPLQLLVATILAAQCTDARVNEVTQDLFKKYKTAEDFAEADPEELQEAIRPTGFFRNKARSIRKMASELVEKHDGKVPGTMKELTDLGGVGRKTAGVILATCFDQPAIIVDTHVSRVTGRIGLTDEKNADKIERDLREIVPEKKWTTFSHTAGFHGRQVCHSRKPDCENCRISTWCDYYAENAG